MVIMQWTGIKGRPFITVSAKGIANGLSTLTNNGADYGIDTPSTITYGIQEALNSIASSGGTIYVTPGQYGTSIYKFSGPIYNTGSNQVVIFDPGCTVTFDKDSTWALHSQYEPAYALIGAGTSHGYGADSGNFGVGNTGANFSYCFWIGNGATIDTQGVGYGSNYVPALFAYGAPVTVFGVEQVGWNDYQFMGTPPTAGTHIVIEGFILKNVTSSAFSVRANNYYGTIGFASPGVNYPNQVRNVRISRIYATWYPNIVPGIGAGFSGPGASGFVIPGSARQVLVEDCVMDTSAVQLYTNGGTTYGNDISNCYVSANGGDCQQIVIRRCTFIQPTFNNGAVPPPYVNGSVFELQGNNAGAAGNPGPRRDSHLIQIEDCVFDSSQGAAEPGGSGGGYADDNNNADPSDDGYITNVVFQRCQFVNVQVNYKTLGSGVFGYFRYTDGTKYAAFGGQTLARRSPADPGIGITGLVSGHAFPLTYGFDVLVVVNGSTTSSIQINGISTGLQSGEFFLRTGDTITITFSGTQPTVTAMAV